MTNSISHPVIEWGPTYATGIEDTDAQRQIMLQCLNRLNRLGCGSEAASRGQLRNALRDALRDLNEHAACLFLLEESLLQRQLPATKQTFAHIRAHRSYWAQIIGLRMRFEAGQPGATEALIAYLNRWWPRHILAMDVKAAQALRRSGLA